MSDSDPIARLNVALEGRYTIERELGEGGMATVYLAEDLKHHRPVAIKVLAPDLAAAVGADRFLREIETAANLTHPHILPLFDSGETNGLVYYVMPYVEGESLRARLDREQQLPVDDAVRITREIADALAYAHEHGVVHRDVKPANILLEAGHAVLADFGVAQAVAGQDESRLTQTGVSLGTPSYMSPEQASGERSLDGRSDQYALGCVLYEMLAGQPPFTGTRIESVVRQHLLADPTPITQLRPTVPEAVAGALVQALAKAPADRFSTTGEFGKVLAAQLQTPAAGTPATSHRKNRSVWGAWSVAVGAVAIAALFVWQPWVAGEGGRAASGPPPWTILAEVEGSAKDSVRTLVRSLLTSDIDATDAVNVLPDAQVQLGFERMVRPDTTHLTTEVASELAERARIETVIVATLDRVGSSYALTIRALEIPGDALLATVQASASGDDALLTASKDAVWDLMAQLEGAFGMGVVRSVATIPMTSSLEAYRKREQGRRFITLGTYREAVQAFREALEIDPEFAEAWSGLGVVFGNMGFPDSADVAYQKALEYPEHLEAYDRLSIEADLTHDPEVILQAQERQYRETGVGFNNYGVSLAGIGRSEEAVAVFADMDRRAPFGISVQAAANWALRLTDLGRTDEAARIADRLEGTPRQAPIRAAIALRAGDWAEAERISRDLVTDPTTGFRAWAMPILASTRAVRGRIEDASALLDEMERTYGTGTALTRLMPSLVVTVASGLIPQTRRTHDLAADATEIDRTLAALWAVELGDTSRARSILAELPDPTLGDFLRPEPQEARVVLLQARLAGKEGDWVEAVRLLQAVTTANAPKLQSADNQLAHWTLAEAEAHLGNLDRAALLFAGLAGGDHLAANELRTVGLTHSFAHRRAALLYGQLSDHDKAVEHWLVFLKDFTDPDPEYEWMVDEARDELARLGG